MCNGTHKSHLYTLDNDDERNIGRPYQTKCCSLTLFAIYYEYVEEDCTLGTRYFKI